MLNKIKSKLLKSKKNGRGRGEEAAAASYGSETPTEMLQLIQEYEKIKENPVEITGEDFDRAFAFLEKYPESRQAKHLLKEMKDTSGQKLKGLSYESAVKIMQQMPDHPGSEAILRGMYKIEEGYISRLKSDILMFILEVAPDHQYAQTLTEAIVSKNFTNAYNFITKNPTHQQARTMIREMFKKDANIAVLLLQEKMDHPQVDAIFEGIYNISSLAVRKLTPNAIIFILDIAPDHPEAEKMIRKLVKDNYIKAFDFVKNHKGYPNADFMVKEICKRQPELKELL